MILYFFVVYSQKSDSQITGKVLIVFILCWFRQVWLDKHSELFISL